MTKEELYKEFLEVTHFDESVITRVEYIKNLNVDGEIVASGFEGILVYIKNGACIKTYDKDITITYFHNYKAGAEAVVNALSVIHEENMAIMECLEYSNVLSGRVLLSKCRRRCKENFEECFGGTKDGNSTDA